MADTINDVLIPVDTPTKLRANEIYAIPSAANQITWQSATGSDLMASVDRTVFGSLGVSLANEPKNVWTAAAFVRTVSADTWVIVKVAPISALSPPVGGGGGGGGTGTEVLHPDGTILLPGIAFLNEPDLGFYRAASGVTALVNGGISEISINGNTHVVAVDNFAAKTRVAIGLIPALTGALRLENAAMIMARNAANTADIPLLGTNVNNEVVFGGPATTNIFNGDTIFNNNITLGPNSYFELYEKPAPPNPLADHANFWLQDNGLGFSQLMIQFFTGPPVALATEGQNFISIGNIPAQSGALRLEYQAMIMARDSSNTYDIPLIGTDVNNNVVIGGSNQDTIINGDTIITGDLTLSGDFITTGGMGLFIDGSITTPSIAFVNEPGLGMYRAGNQMMNLTAAGQVQMSVDGNTDTVGFLNIRAINGTFTGFGAFGTSPATSGTLRLPLNGAIKFHGLDIFDIPALTVNAQERLILGAVSSTSTWVEGASINLNASPGGVSVVNGVLALGGAPAAVGNLRFSNQQTVYWRNPQNTGDTLALHVNANNDVAVGQYGAGNTLYLDAFNVTVRAGGAVYINSPTLWGPAPSASGSLRLSNNWAINWRNPANNADIAGLNLDSSGNLIVGHYGGATTYFDGSNNYYRSYLGGHYFAQSPVAYAFLVINDQAATTGTIRIPTNSSIMARNGANTADLRIFRIDSGNNLYFGDTANPTLQVFSQSLQLQPTANLTIGNPSEVASIGAIRIKAQTAIYSRDVSNVQDILCIGVSGGNEVIVGGYQQSATNCPVWLKDVLLLRPVPQPTFGNPSSGMYIYSTMFEGKQYLQVRFANGQIVNLAGEV